MEASIGHNNPPLIEPNLLETLNKRRDECVSSAQEWVNSGGIETEANAALANDFLAGSNAIIKESESHRKQIKEPHLQAGRDIDATFKTIAEPVKSAHGKVKDLLDEYLRKKELEAERERARVEEERRKTQEALDRAKEQGNIALEADCTLALRSMEKPKDFKVKVGSATGSSRSKSLKDVYVAEIQNPRLAAMRLSGHPFVLEAVLKAANAEMRKSTDKSLVISGINFRKEKKL